MHSVLHGLAVLLADADVGAYDPDGVPVGEWVICLEHQPPEPGQTITLYQLPGSEAPGQHGWAEPRVQVRVRGTTDTRVSHDKAQGVYQVLHGLSYRDLPGGLYLVDCVGTQSGPVHAGPDTNGLHQHTVTFRCSIEHPI